MGGKRKTEFEVQLRRLGYSSEPTPEQLAARFAATKARLGDTGEKLLAWVVNFAQRDLTTVGVGERLDLADDLCIFPELVYHQPPPLRRRLHPIAEAEMFLLQKEFRSALKEFVAGEGWTFRGSMVVRLRTDAATGQRRVLLHPCVVPELPRDIIVGALVPLLSRVGDRLRVCPARDCGRIFLGYGKQLFCSVGHAQRARNDVSYLKRRAKELGKPKEKVKINRRTPKQKGA